MIAVGMIVMPVRIHDVRHGHVGHGTNPVDHSPRDGRVDVGVDDQNAVVIDDHHGIAVDRPGQRVCLRVQVDAVPSDCHV